MHPPAAAKAGLADCKCILVRNGLIQALFVARKKMQVINLAVVENPVCQLMAHSRSRELAGTRVTEYLAHLINRPSVDYCIWHTAPSGVEVTIGAPGLRSVCRRSRLAKDQDSVKRMSEMNIVPFQKFVLKIKTRVWPVRVGRPPCLWWRLAVQNLLL